MTGLLLKDFLNMKKQAAALLVMTGLFCLVTAFSKTSSALCAFVCAISVSMTVFAVAYDERSKFDAMALTMPVTRTALVVEKYLLGGIFAAAGAFLCFLFSLPSGDTVFNIFILSVTVFAGSVIFLSIILPVIFKFGTERARLYMIFIVMLPVLAVMSLQFFDTKWISDSLINALPYVVTAAAVLFTAVSIPVSVGIYRRKEF